MKVDVLIREERIIPNFVHCLTRPPRGHERMRACVGAVLERAEVQERVRVQCEGVCKRVQQCLEIVIPFLPPYMMIENPKLKPKPIKL